MNIEKALQEIINTALKNANKKKPCYRRLAICSRNSLRPFESFRRGVRK